MDRGPLAKGYAKGAPYDFILIDGAVEQVPRPIVEQAGEGATIALALLDEGVSRLAAGRVVAGAFGATIFADAETAPLPGFGKPRGFSF